MISTTILCKKLLNVNGFVVDNVSFFNNEYDELCVLIKVHLRKGLQWRCPECGKRHTKIYDAPYEHKRWRALDFGGILVYIEAYLPRICCKEHGVKTADVPWAFPNSRFTKDFDYTVTWMGKYLNRSAIAKYMRIDWRTVGRCIKRVHEDLEPDVNVRLDGVSNIGIDETSFRKGHSYITVVVNHDTNTVIWASNGHGKSILKKFCEKLTPEQRASIKIVTGDGAKWITDCVKEYFPNAERCVDPFHVVEWATEALDKVRIAAWRRVLEDAKAAAVEKGKDRPKKDDAQVKIASDAKKRADQIKKSMYSLGKAPEHLTSNQAVRLEMIAKSDKRLYRAYLLKEKLRLIFKIDDVDEAEQELTAWVNWARRCRIPEFVELQRKIMRHKKHILNTIRFNANNALSEATNNKIKLLIRQAYGFQDVDNMIHMVMLYCSDLKIPLPNRGTRRGGFSQAA